VLLVLTCLGRSLDKTKIYVRPTNDHVRAWMSAGDAQGTLTRSPTVNAHSRPWSGDTYLAMDPYSGQTREVEGPTVSIDAERGSMCLAAHDYSPVPLGSAVIFRMRDHGFFTAQLCEVHVPVLTSGLVNVEGVEPLAPPRQVGGGGGGGGFQGFPAGGAAATPGAFNFRF